MKILIVEDEIPLREGLSDLVRGAGHVVATAADGARAVELGTAEPFDLILLDLMLPKIDGIEVCRRLRRARPELPILMLTARGDEEDKVGGLRAGADDYLTKPFGARELLARIDALARRSRANDRDAEVVEIDGLSIDLGRCVAQRDGKPIELTAREVGILRWLHAHRKRASSRAELLEHVWGARGDLETRTVDVTIANLRQKIERDPSSPRIIRSVKGIGYGWNGEEPAA